MCTSKYINLVQFRGDLCTCKAEYIKFPQKLGFRGVFFSDSVGYIFNVESDMQEPKSMVLNY